MLRGLPGVCGYFRREARELGGKRHRMRDRATDGMFNDSKVHVGEDSDEQMGGFELSWYRLRILLFY